MRFKRITACLLLLCLLPALRVSAEQSAPIIYRYASKTGPARVALTFDDGPHPRYTPAILDILQEYGIKATFFAVGVNAETYPHLIKRILAEGHELGNHT